MVKFLPNELSAIDVINIATFNKEIRTAVNAFGRDAYQSRYGGKAVPWKLVRKVEGESTDEYIARLSVINPKVSAGLTNAISISKRHTEKGVATVIYKDGSTGIMPVKAAVMAKEGKNHNVVRFTPYESARAALPAFRMAQSVPVMA